MNEYGHLAATRLTVKQFSDLVANFVCENGLKSTELYHPEDLDAAFSVASRSAAFAISYVISNNLSNEASITEEEDLENNYSSWKERVYSRAGYM